MCVRLVVLESRIYLLSIFKPDIYLPCFRFVCCLFCVCFGAAMTATTVIRMVATTATAQRAPLHSILSCPFHIPAFVFHFSLVPICSSLILLLIYAFFKHFLCVKFLQFLFYISLNAEYFVTENVFSCRPCMFIVAPRSVASA